jgi:hypothetical protein
MWARLLLAMVSLLLAPASAVADEVLATVPGAGRISAYGGWIVMSVVVDRERWLNTWHDGVLAPLNVRANPSPDFDVGPDAAGRPTLVYSRCVRYPRGCDLFAVTLGEGVERRLPVSQTRYSEFAPAIWGDMLVFGRRAKGQRRAEIVLTQPGKPSRRIPAGTLPGPCPDPEFCSEQPAEAYPSESDLGPQVVAYNWQMWRGNTILGWGSELRVAGLQSRRSRIAAIGWADGTCGGRTFSPSVAGTVVRYGREVCNTGFTERFALDGLRRSAAPLPGPLYLWSLAWDGDVLYTSWFAGELIRSGSVGWQAEKSGEVRPPLET